MEKFLKTISENWGAVIFALIVFWFFLAIIFEFIDAIIKALK